MSIKYIKNAIIDNARKTRRQSKSISQKNLFVEKDVILALPETGVEFYACDVIKLINNGVDSYPLAKNFTGTEEQNPTVDADKYVVGVVQIGNGATDVDTIQVRIGGSMEVRLGNRITPIVVGTKLYVDTGNLDACVAEGSSAAGSVALFEAMEASTDSAETVIEARFLSGGGGTTSTDYQFKVYDVSDYTPTGSTGPVEPDYKVSREGGSVRIGNSTQNINADITERTITETTNYWHLKWTYSVVAPSVGTFEDPVDYVDTDATHSEKLPTPSDPIGEIWITIAKITIVDLKLVIVNYITSTQQILVYNSCGDGIRTEVTP